MKTSCQGRALIFSYLRLLPNFSVFLLGQHFQPLLLKGETQEYVSA